MKYVIWGAGVLGKRLYEFLGSDVSAFIDSNPKVREAQEITDIPIIDFAEYLRSYRQCYILISPRFTAADSIERVLRQQGIDHYARLDADRERFYEYDRAEVRKILHELVEDKDCVHFVRQDIFTIVLGNYARDLGKAVIYGGEQGDKQELAGKVLFLHDTAAVFAGTRKDFSNPRLKKFQNIHKGKRLFLIATGPSLQARDLDVLYSRGEICLGVNSIYRIFGQTNWRPDYWVAADPLVLKLYCDVLLESSPTIPKFITDHYPQLYDGREDFYIYHSIIDTERSGFATDIAPGVYSCFGTVVFHALQIAVYMGATEIYLLGCDFSNIFYTPGSQVEHFADDDKFDKMGQEFTTHKYMDGKKSMDMVAEAYELAQRETEKLGVKIYNATRGGFLEVFPRRDFDSLFVD